MIDPIGQTVGLYEIVAELGAGTMGTVYKAYRPVLKRHVAIKVLHEQLGQDPHMVARFQHGAMAAARLLHPNVIAIFDVGEESGLHYVAMDYVAGPSLAQRLQAEGPLRLETALGILRQVSAALSYAHANGVVHGNIKPSNILLARNDQAILTDFVDTSASASPSTHAIAGAAEYLSPEQAQGQELDARSDVYSLGIVLYQMLAGRVPFSAETPAATLRLQVHERPPAPSSLNASIRKPVEKVILRALSKEKVKRYGTAAELVRAFSRAAGLRGPLPEPVSLPSLSGGLRPAHLILGGLALAVVAGLAFAGFSGRQAPPAPTPTATAVLAAASTATRAPSATATARVPTETEAPLTPTPSLTAAAAPVATTTATATPSMAPTPSATPTLAPAPVLILPSNGAVASGVIGFRWRWVRPLLAGEHFDLRVWAEGTPHLGIAWTEEPRCEVRYLDPGYYHWSVIVIRETVLRADGSMGWEPVSLESASQPFVRSQASPTPLPTETAKPEPSTPVP